MTLRALTLLLPALGSAFTHGGAAIRSVSIASERAPLVTPKLAVVAPKLAVVARAREPVMTAVPAIAVNLGVDVTSASITALAVAPLLAAFDEAITRSAAGGNLWQA